LALALRRRNQAASDFLIANLPYLRRSVALAIRDGEDRDELFQEAFLGLARASEKFDPSRGYRFYVYASYWMRNFIVRWRENLGSLIRVPVHRLDAMRRAEWIASEIFGETGRVASHEDVASHVG